MSRDYYVVEEDTTITVTRIPQTSNPQTSKPSSSGENEVGPLGMLFGAIFWIVVILLCVKGCC
jgi:hypothetical protein